MNKLRLQLEDIAVESFSTQEAGARRGTVAANATTGNQIICDCPTNGFEQTCRTCSCEGTCDGTCVGCATSEQSCNGTCDSCYESCGGSCDPTCAGGTCPYCTNPGQIICG